MKLALPLQGVVDIAPSGEQRVTTTRDMLNMRGIDPRTKQRRLAQRAGLSKFIATPVNGTAPVRAVRTVTYSRKGVTYAEKASTSSSPLGTADVSASVRTGTAATVTMNDTDRFGNLYSTDGNTGIEKRNSELVLQWRQALPVAQDTAVCRALKVGPVAGGSNGVMVFAGQSSGGRQVDAKFWGYKQVTETNDQNVDETKLELVFERKAGAYTERFALYNGRLYCAQNEPDKGQSWVRVYIGLETPNPEVEFEFEVPHPVRDIDVRQSDGAIITCHPQNEDRGIDPRAPYYSPRDLAREWRIEDHLTDYDKRIWAHYKAKALGEQLELVDGAPVAVWPDLGPSFRDLVGDSSDPDNVPFWVKNGIGGQPSVRFAGNSARLNRGVANTVGNVTPILVSGTNPSTQAQYDDQQRTVLPAFPGGRWAMFIVLRPSTELPFKNSSTVQFYPPAVFSQVNDGSASNAGDLGDTLLVNATQVPKRSSAADTVTACEPGGLVLFTSTDGTNEGGGKQDPDGGGNLPFSGWTGQSPGACIVTIINDGGANGSTDAAQHSTWRIDGRPIDRWLSRPFIGTRQTEVGSLTQDVDPGGVAPIDGNKFVFPWTFYDGDIAEIIVLRDYPDGTDHTGTGNAHGDPVSGNLANNASPPTQHYPRAIGTYGAAAVTYAAAAGNRYNDNEIERIEGMLAGEYGIAHKLPCGTASVLQTTASPAVGDDVTIDGVTYTLVNAFTGALNEVMHPSATPHPSMFDAGVCLLRLMRAINASGREGVEYSQGQEEHPTVVATSLNGQTNTQVARLKIETKGLTAVSVSDTGANWSWSNATTSTQATVTGASNTFMPGHYPHPFNVNYGYPRPDPDSSTVGATVESKGKLLNSTEALLARWDARGKIVWVLASRDSVVTPAGTLPSSNQRFGGLGFACHWSLDGDAIYSVGDQYTVSPSGTSQEAWVRRILDTPTGYDISSTGAWSIGSMTMIGNAANTHALYPGGIVKIDVDEYDNVYVPYDSPPVVNGVMSLVVINASGTPIWHWRAASGSTNPAGACVSVDKSEVDYDGDPVTRAFACYLGTRMGYTSDTLTQDNIYRIEPVSVVHSVGVPVSDHKIVAVADGKIRRSYGGGAFADPAGTGTLAADVLAVDADNVDGHIAMATLRGHAFITDGVTMVDFDARRDTLAYVTATKGELKKRARGVVAWRDRLVWYRFADSPHQYLMSASGDSYDYDISPPVQTATQAVLGTLAPRGTGQSPDIINEIVPFSNDTAIFLCQTSVWRLDGDPMDGGRFWLVSDSTGGAFGGAWCKDEYGTLYFFGTRGCVYAYSPGSGKGLVPLSESAIPERLRAIDFSTTRVKLLWNNEDQGVHVLLTSSSVDTPEQREHYFWSRQTGGWYPDSFGSDDLQPSATFVGDGDLESNRKAVMGCNDGYLRCFDSAVDDDDGTPIPAHALIGPLQPEDMDGEVRFAQLAAVLASAQGGCGYQFYASDTPDDLGAAVYTGTLEPGRNPIHPVRARGAYVAMQVSNATLSRFAIESLHVDAFEAGRKMPR